MTNASGLQAHHISLRYSAIPILDNIDFNLAPGELVGLIGPNGAGKTTLLKILAGLQQPDSGELLLHGTNLTAIAPKLRGRTLAYLEQGAPAYWPLTARRVIELGRLPHLNPWQKLSAVDHDIIERAMVKADVHMLGERIVTTLSGGERLRVMLARIFATEPEIILADEPIAALDPYHQLHTMELLQQHCRAGGSAVVVLHDLNMAVRYCDRLVLLNLGHIAHDGTAQALLDSDHLAKVYGIHVTCINDEHGLWVLPTGRIIWPG